MSQRVCAGEAHTASVTLNAHEYLSQNMNEAPIFRAEKELIERPDTVLSGLGADAWQAYNAMETTKRRHFDLLEILDNKKKNYNIDPTALDQQLIANLLKDHDEQVKRFTSASIALKENDAEAHTALFVYIGSINKGADDNPTTH